MRPPATGRPARTTPHSPRALVPVDAATHAPGPGLGPRAALPASRGSHGPQGAPDRHADTLARAPPAAWPAQRARPRHAPAPHSVGPLEPLLTAGWAAHASQRPPRPPHPLGRPPLPMRPAPASAPGQRNQLTAGPSARRGARTGHADALARAPSAAWPAGRALPGTPTDPTVWGAQGHCRPPAGPPATPRDRHGPRTRMAPRPTRPPAATLAPGPGCDPPPAVPRGLPYARHRDRHQGTAPEPNIARQRQ